MIFLAIEHVWTASHERIVVSLGRYPQQQKGALICVKIPHYFTVNPKPLVFFVCFV